MNGVVVLFESALFLVLGSGSLLSCDTPYCFLLPDIMIIKITSMKLRHYSE